MRIVAISDTHGDHEKWVIPPGDLLIHGGDCTRVGREKEIQAFDRWLAGLPHPHKVMIAGNHDMLFENEPNLARSLIAQATYLEDSETEIQGLRIYGSPWQPWFMNWAFNLSRGKQLEAKWEMIPEGIDILITHGPPMGILDSTRMGQSVGCEDLRKRVEVIRPRFHIFGHIHESAGVVRTQHTTFINATCFGPWGAPIVFDLE